MLLSGRQNRWTHNDPGGMEKTAGIQFGKPSLRSARSREFTFTQQINSLHVVFTHVPVGVYAVWVLLGFFPANLLFSSFLPIKVRFIFTHAGTFSHLTDIFHDRMSLPSESERADDLSPKVDVENGSRLRAAALVVHSGVKVGEKTERLLYPPRA